MRSHAISTRILSVVLALMLVLGMLPVISMAANTTTIYFENTENWSTVKVYYWGGSSSVTWPGVNMTLVDGKIYSYDVPADATMVIFNNGSKQTADLKKPTNGDNLYTYSTGKWSTYVPSDVCEHSWDSGSFISKPTCVAAGQASYTCTKCGVNYTADVPANGHSFTDGACTVCGVNEYRVMYFVNTAGWAAVNAYFWCDAGNLTSWPGESMELVSGDVWKYKVPGDAQYIIFNNGSDTQTSDLTISADKDMFTYGGDWSVYSPDACTHEWDNGTVVTTPDCTTEGKIDFVCTLCGETKSVTENAKGHSYSAGVCTVCGEPKPVLDFYLVGFINGADYGFQGDSENMGEYKFINGTLVATFTADSYVFVKTEGNANWYLCETYCSDTTATLYENAGEKMFVPGNVELTFTLVENPDGSLTLSYATDVPPCTHASHTAEGICEQCGKNVGHDYLDDVCRVCGEPKPVLDFYLVGYINGADYGIEGDSANMGEYKFVDGSLTVNFTADSYVFVKTTGNANWYLTESFCSDTSATLVEGGSEKMFVPGNVELAFTLTENLDGSLTLSYEIIGEVCEHKTHTFEGICESCGRQVGHSYVEGVCTVCGEEEPVVVENYYIQGYLNGADYTGTDYLFVDGKLTVTFSQDSYVFLYSSVDGEYMAESYISGTSGIFYPVAPTACEKMFVPGNVEIVFTLVDNGDNTLTLSYSYNEDDICKHDDHDVNGICTQCGANVEHSYVEGICSVCGGQEPAVDFYLIGYINGANYGCEEDYENMGEYKFVDGKLVATFESDSYVFIKTTGNAKWYMTQAYVQDVTATFVIGGSEKMFVPANVKLVFTLVENPDGSLTLSYEEAPTGDGSVSGTITSYGSNGDVVTIELLQNGSVVSATTVTGKIADYAFSGVASGEYTLRISKVNHVTREYTITVDGSVVQDGTVCLLGDVNGDGKVNMKDWNRMYEHTNEINELTGYALACADANSDKKVNMKDWNRLYEHVNEINPLW